MRTCGENVMSCIEKKTMKKKFSGKHKFKVWVEEDDMTQNENQRIIG